MTLYEAVYTRKSIRNFRKDKVETSILEGMIQFYHEMEPLFPGIETSIELIDTQGSKKAKSRLGGIINVAAPYYLVIYTEDKERADMNAGYIMQQISLYLFSKGVGSCFQGMGHLKGEMPKEGMRCVILMAIGYPKVDMVRNQEDAKRESMEDLCAVKEPPRRFVNNFWKWPDWHRLHLTVSHGVLSFMKTVSMSFPNRPSLIADCLANTTNLISASCSQTL